jgi:Dyp-type peroxidase family
MSTTNLELDDIQGNVLAGFNTNVEVLIGLTVDDKRSNEVAVWLEGLAPQVTTVADVREQRRTIKSPEETDTPLTWLCLAIGARLLSTIRVDLFIRDEAFNGGFLKRAAGALGDRTDPATWRVGGPESRVDVLLIVASNDEPAATQRAATLIQEASNAGLVGTYYEVARRIADLEHFGFRDGISQPEIKGFHLKGTIGPGHFVFGYEREQGDGGYNPAVDPQGFLRNGSFLVFRRLAQDVEGFRHFCRNKVMQISNQWPGMSDQYLAALLVGRWPSGALVSTLVQSDPGLQPNENDFDYSDDASGHSCPFGAHIRKVNPRAGPKDITLTPRILRRGIPFGPPFAEKPEQERGLAFVSFQTSIRGQLEFLTGGWMNSPMRPATRSGHDLLVGRASGSRSLDLRGPFGPVQVTDDNAQWITPTGGAYLFAPGRSAISRLATPTAAGSVWRAKKAFAIASAFLIEH